MGIPRRGRPISGRGGKSGQEVGRVGEDWGSSSRWGAWSTADGLRLRGIEMETSQGSVEAT